MRYNLMEKYRLHLLLSREQITSIVQGLANRISKDYVGRDLVFICILKGAFVFFADLIRQLAIPAQFDFIQLASYGSGMKTSGKVNLIKDIGIPIEKKDVVIIEDIIDSGRTLLLLRDHLSRLNPRSLKICALLDKKARREVEIEADYLGMEVEDVFIVGYGIDFNENHRTLPEIYYVSSEEREKG